MNWQSFGDETPLEEPILVWVANGGDQRQGALAIGWAYRGHDDAIVARSNFHQGKGWNITHWMPLPDAPKD